MGLENAAPSRLRQRQAPIIVQANTALSGVRVGRRSQRIHAHYVRPSMSDRRGSVSRGLNNSTRTPGAGHAAIVLLLMSLRSSWTGVSISRTELGWQEQIRGPLYLFVSHLFPCVFSAVKFLTNSSCLCFDDVFVCVIYQVCVFNFLYLSFLRAMLTGGRTALPALMFF